MLGTIFLITGPHFLAPLHRGCRARGGLVKTPDGVLAGVAARTTVPNAAHTTAATSLVCASPSPACLPLFLPASPPPTVESPSPNIFSIRHEAVIGWWGHPTAGVDVSNAMWLRESICDPARRVGSASLRRQFVALARACRSTSMLADMLLAAACLNPAVFLSSIFLLRLTLFHYFFLLLALLVASSLAACAHAVGADSEGAAEQHCFASCRVFSPRWEAPQTFAPSCGCTRAHPCARQRSESPFRRRPRQATCRYHLRHGLRLGCCKQISSRQARTRHPEPSSFLRCVCVCVD